ncbi:hypothetical protein AB0N14_17785 [Streptomyces sp. NPDC051104]|uniref:hypothetical protein n=1 Tax=Streptomyces sp. NPDC051104 TaxID=3155044 RepID=UPI00343FAE59
MTTQPASRPAYEIPTHLGAAAHAALDADRAARDQLGRAMLVATAAAVRDILTGYEPDAPFDASAVELVEGEDGSLFPNGRYWTLAGEERTFTETVGAAEAGNGIHGMSEWTAYLNDSTRDVWYDLCTEQPDRDGRPAYRLDLLPAAALQLDESAPAPVRQRGQMVEVLVCANDSDRYPAMVDPDDQRDGYVKPWFDLDTVRRIAEQTQADAARYGHDSVDTVHVLEGGDCAVRHDGSTEPLKYAVVLVVCWMYLDGEKREQAVQVLQPNKDGRYAVGGHDWQWYALGGQLNPQIPFRP